MLRRDHRHQCRLYKSIIIGAGKSAHCQSSSQAQSYLPFKSEFVRLGMRMPAVKF